MCRIALRSDRLTVWFFLVSLASLLSTTGCGGPRPLETLARTLNNAEGEAIAMRFRSVDVTDAEMQTISNYPQLQSVALQDCKKLTDAALVSFPELPRLRRVELMRTRIGDDGLKHLSGVDSLRELVLAHTGTMGYGLEHLSPTGLTYLEVHSNRLTGEGLGRLAEIESLKEVILLCPTAKIAEFQSLAQLTNLQTLIIDRTPLGEDGLERLRPLKNLRKLVIDGSTITDENVSALNDLTELRHLSLGGAPLTDEGLKSLNLPNLKYLALRNCIGITDDGLANLDGLPKLKRLSLLNAGVRGRDLTGLQSLPNLRAVELSGDQFQGGTDAVTELKKVLPDCTVEILRG